MDLRVLEYFLTIAREENITKAAQILHVTQPTLSRQLMQLEEELGVKLFDRSNHSVILTDEGMLFRRRAGELIELAARAKRELNTKEQVSGEITVGSGELLTFSYLSEVISRFRRENPLVTFDLYSGNADGIKERIEKGLVDVGLLLTPVDIGKYEFLDIPGKEVWGVYVHEGSPSAKKEFFTPDDLLKERILMTKRTAMQKALGEWFGRDFGKLNIIATYNLLGNAAVLVQQGAGVAIGLKRNCSYDNVRFIPLSPSFTSGAVLVWKKNQSLFPALDAFLTYAKKYNFRMPDDEI